MFFAGDIDYLVNYMANYFANPTRGFTGGIHMKKKKLTIILSILAILVIGAVFAGFSFSRSLKEAETKLADFMVADVDLSKIADGEYLGSYDAFPVAVEVNVSISGGAITAIDIIKHQQGQGTPAEILADKVFEAQSLHVDTVAGATHSSKVILKAIEDALHKAAEGGLH